MKNKYSRFILILLICFQCSFFLPIKFASIILILLVVLTIVIIKDVKSFPFSNIKWLFVVYFFVLVIGGVKTNNYGLYLGEIEQNLSFLALPFISQLFFFLNKKQLELLKKTYIFIATFLLVICFFRAFKDYYYTGYYKLLNPDGVLDRNRFLYHEFTRYVGFHALYFAFYLSLSLIFLISLLKKVKYTNVITTLILFTVLGILLCKSAIFYFFLFLLGIYYIYTDIRINKFLKISLLIVLVLFVYQLLKFKLNTFYFSFDIENMLKYKTAVNIRLLKWYSTIEIWKNNVFFGVGTGNTVNMLISKYKEIGFEEGFKYKYNSHNQFLTILLRNGLIGLSVFLLIFIKLLKKAFKIKDRVAFFFIFTFFLFGLVESVFERQRGIVYVLYFILLLDHKMNIIYKNNDNNF